jgi:hypothetical protein
VLLALQGACKREKPFARQDWIPEDGSFSISVPQPGKVYHLTGGMTQYTFYGMDPRAAGPLVTVRVEVKSPNLPSPYTTDRFYDLYDRAYRAERGAVVSTTDVMNNGYRGKQFEITAGPHAPLILRLFVTNDRTYWVEWNPQILHSTETANTFLMPQGATQ